MSTATLDQPIVAASTKSNKPAVKAEAPKPAVVETPKAPTVKQTPVEERKYQLTKTGREYILPFRGKQRQIVFNVLKAADKPLTYSEVAREAEKMELKAIGGVDLSCRYHLHHLTLENLSEVTNPTIDVAADPTIQK